MASQAKFLDFIDMIDGGGAGRMGDTFQGGGIFSALANLMATPYGSEDEGRRASREAFLRSRGLLDEPAASAAQSAAAPVMAGPTREQRMSAAAAEMARQRRMRQDALDPRGPNQMNVPAPSYAMPDELSGVPFNNTPNPFTGPTYDMPMARPVAPKEPLGVTTRDMALADIEARKAAYEAAYPNDRSYGGSFGMEKLLVGGSRGLGDITDHLGRFSDSTQDRMYSKLLPTLPKNMQYSGRGTASGDAEFDRFLDMVRAMPGQGALANDPELAFSIFQRMKAAGNLPSVMMYQ